MVVLKTIGLASVKTPGTEHELFDHVQAAARGAIGEDAFNIAWETGQDISIEDAVSEAQDLVSALVAEDGSDPIA